MNLSSELKIFVEKHEGADAHSLALQGRKFPDLDMEQAIRQIVGRRIAKEKISTWYANAEIIYPAHLSLEQCSSEATALYKVSLTPNLSPKERGVAGASSSPSLEGLGEVMIDLTGGMGVDISFLAKNFKQAIYVEQQQELCEIAKHNFRALGLENIKVLNADAVKYLAETEKVDLIYIDPARRDNIGKKTVSIEDCTPNILEIENLLEEKAETVMIKLSPMLDISLALRSLKNVSDVHIVAVNNEVKELLFFLWNANYANDANFRKLKDKSISHIVDYEQYSICDNLRNLRHLRSKKTQIHCINIQKNTIEKFIFNKEEESGISVDYTSELGRYLYEPNASIMKGGAYKSIARAYNLQKLHPSSHLYTSDEFHADFPGRKFAVKDVCSLKNVGATLAQESPLNPPQGGLGLRKISSASGSPLRGRGGLSPLRANITTRNFPLSVAEIRKKTGLKEGGDIYIFATTLADERKVLIIAEKN